MGIQAMKAAFNRHHTLIVTTTMLVILTSLLIPVRAQAPFTVNSTGDDLTCDGTTCTLRAAITNANATAGNDTITFNIPGGPANINITSPLPDITEAVNIRGLTQPGGATCTAPFVTVNGNNTASAGLTLTTSSVTIEGLVITGFNGDGISIDGNTNTITCNTVSTNTGNGVQLVGAGNSGNLITGNRIINNTLNGVAIAGAGSVGNRLSGNSISGNGQLGIDLGANGVTNNDALDADTGANTLQNYPSLTAARITGTNVVVTGRLNSTASSTFNLEFFSSPTCSPSSFGQGATPLVPFSSSSVTTDSMGTTTFTITVPLVAAGTVITSTATSAGGDTSEFSGCVTVAAPAPRYNSSPPPGQIRLDILQGQQASQTISINNIGTGDLVITSYSISGNNRLTVSGKAAPFTLVDTGGTEPLTVTCASNDVPNPNPFSGTLTVNHNATGSPAVYTIVCGVVTGGAVPIYVSAPFAPSAAIDFGTTLVGSVTPTNLTISNIGSAPLSISNIALTGLNATEFRFSPSPPYFPIQPNTSQPLVLVLACAPSSVGFKTATLQIITNDPSRTFVTYVLNCVGSNTVVPTNTPGGPVVTSAFPTAIVPTGLGPAQGNVIEVEGLAVRTGPYLGATLIGRIEPGTNYNILGKSQDEGEYTWYYVRASDTLLGWVSGRYLRVTGNIDIVPTQGSFFDQIDGAPETGVTAIANAIIDIRRRPSARTNILSQLPPNGVFSIIGRTRQNGGNFWLHIRYNGLVGWIPASPIDIRGSMDDVPIR